MCFFTRHHIVFRNGTGLVLHLTDQLDTAFALNQIILATLYILCMEARFAKMQTICRPCHSQACQCSALIDEGEEVIQCTLKYGFRPDFNDMFECNWLRQQVQLHFGKPVSHFKVWGFLWSIHCLCKGGLRAYAKERCLRETRPLKVLHKQCNGPWTKIEAKQETNKSNNTSCMESESFHWLRQVPTQDKSHRSNKLRRVATCAFVIP